MQRKYIPAGYVPKVLLMINIIVALIYFSWWFDMRHVANVYLYSLLFFGEFYHVFMAIAFWLTVWPGSDHYERKKWSHRPTIDIFIPVAGEPVDIVVRTVIAAKEMKGYKKNIYILNDGYVAKKENWQDIEQLAVRLGVNCLTREIAHGAKAGNINDAIQVTSGEIIVIFDADMKAYPSFLEKVIPYFQDKKIGFVQTPQYYVNHQDNYVSEGAWEQQEFFYGTIMQGKSYRNSAFICGTNVAIRRSVLEKVGGMYEKNIAEDFLTSLFIHGKGWRSVYTREILSEGLAPQDLGSYYKQQLRWASGSLEVLFWRNPLLNRHLSWAQRIQYLSSAAYYFNGIIVLIDALMPLIFLFTGIHIVAAATTTFAFYFVPFMFLNLYTLYLASSESLTFKAISFSQASFVLQLEAVVAAITRKKMSFAVTSKQKHDGNYLYIVIPHIGYILLAIVGIVIGLEKYGLTPSVVTNIAWLLFNCVLFVPFIQASFPQQTIESKKITHNSLASFANKI